MYPFENPPLPEGEEVESCDITFTKPQDNIVLRLISEELFSSNVDYLDPDLLNTPISSDIEESGEEIDVIDIPRSEASIKENSGNEKERNPVTQEESVKEKSTAPLSTEDVEKLAKENKIEKLAKENKIEKLAKAKEIEIITIEDDVDYSTVVSRNIDRIDLDSGGFHTNRRNEARPNEKPIPAKTIEEIDLDSDHSQTSYKSKKNCDKENTNVTKVRFSTNQGINSDIDKFIENMRRRSDDQRETRDVTPIQSSHRERNVQSTGNRSSSKSRSSSLIRPKKNYRRYQSPDLTPYHSSHSRERSPFGRECYPSCSRDRYPSRSRERSPGRERYPSRSRERSPHDYSTRAQEHRSPHLHRHRAIRDWYYPPQRSTSTALRRYQTDDRGSRRSRRDSSDGRYSSPETDERGRRRSRQDSSDGGYSSPEASRKKRQKIVHYIDSDEDFEVSEIKISSKLRKRGLVPASQNITEEQFQRDSIPDDSNSPKNEASEAKVDIKGIAFENFYCKHCQLTLNSKLTWESHIVGKRHKKAIECLAIHDVAKGSVRIPPNPEFASTEKPRFAAPTAGKKYVPTNDIALLQRTVDEHSRDPMPGLDCVIEIKSGNVITYYCSLCDAPCQPITIMPHLIGYNHQLACLKEIDEEVYNDAINTVRKKAVIRRVLSALFKHQDQKGKGRIRVYEEKPDPNAIIGPIEQLYFDRPGPSWGNVAMKQERDESTERGELPNAEYLDTSKSDFYCKLCDSHMNNLNMWASHVRGKRHIKNAKKAPGEEPGKKKAVKAPSDYQSKLEIMLDKEARGEVIVGLNYIKETQSRNGEIYTCFLCCACATNYDILDHLLLTKHRTKYLEKLNTDGKKNGIDDIAHMDINNTYMRDNLIKGECMLMLEKYGPGKVEVYISKDECRGRILPHFH